MDGEAEGDAEGQDYAGDEGEGYCIGDGEGVSGSGVGSEGY